MKATTSTLTADQYLVIHSVGPNQQGIRLDLFLKERYPKRSRVQLQEAIESGVVSIRRAPGNHLMVGQQPKPSSPLSPGDEIGVLTERKTEPEVNFQYHVIFEDEFILVIDKPPCLPVHPAGRYFFNTLLIHLKTAGHQKPLKLDFGDVEESNILKGSRHSHQKDPNKDFFCVHRIDKETSGVLVVAKTKAACIHLTRQFAERQPEKKYWAIVKGICPETFHIDLSLKRSQTSLIRLKMTTASVDEGGQWAYTSFKRLQVLDGFSWIECMPKTGRQHQIRVHLEAAGYPLVGDKLYGWPEQEALQFYESRYLSAESEAKLLLPRHALHAAEICFIHPVSEKKVCFSAPLPEDLKNFLWVHATSSWSG